MLIEGVGSFVFTPFLFYFYEPEVKKANCIF